MLFETTKKLHFRSNGDNYLSALSEKKRTPHGNPASLYSITTLRKERPDWFREDLAQVFDLLAEGKINPLIAARFPLRDAAESHALLETSQTAGKIVLIGS
ncbi:MULTISPECIES: zinc-binding dehydrogenase [Paenibacillus]|uniref:zinc-binding dehydrogenase n=1 Tax=Paenibacillus TaxID=44249 RepID=UPI00119DECDB|nr:MULTISPECIES: zinc-binding dehydrogenase [Paenibacillus]MBJ9993648.1 zinc-binding dehydrogenase [Paenibacillus sp. S28]